MIFTTGDKEDGIVISSSTAETIHILIGTPPIETASSRRTGR